MTGGTSTTQVAKSTQLVDSEQELRKLLADELQRDTHGGEIVVMAGHYMLFMDETRDQLVAGVLEEQTSEAVRDRLAKRVGIFPGYSWDLGADIAEDLLANEEQVRLLLLINDWQYVPAGARSAGELRASYFDGFTELPQRYTQRLAASPSLTPAHVLPSRRHPLAFPETWLKYRFQKAAEKFVKTGHLEKRVLDDQPNQSEVSFLDADGNYRTLISCGVTGCAGEITEMISEIYIAGHRTVLIFAPGECLAPVQSGVDVALALYGLRDMHVIVADLGGSGEMSSAEIFSNMISVVTFRS
jgi:hypothetical protein